MLEIAFSGERGIGVELSITPLILKIGCIHKKNIIDTSTLEPEEGRGEAEEGKGAGRTSTRNQSSKFIYI